MAAIDYPLGEDLEARERERLAAEQHKYKDSRGSTPNPDVWTNSSNPRRDSSRSSIPTNLRR